MRIESLSRCPCPPLSPGGRRFLCQEKGRQARPTGPEASVSCACLTPAPVSGSCWTWFSAGALCPV